MTFDEMSVELGNYYIHRDFDAPALVVHIRNVHRVICNRIPFEELQATDILTCTIDNPVIDLNSTTPDLAGIMWMRINYSATSSVRLQKGDIRNFDNMPTAVSRKPVNYGRFAKTIELWPPPSEAFTIDLRYWRKPTENVTLGATVIQVPDHWLELMKWEVTYRYWMSIGKFSEAQALVIGSMQPKMPSPKRTDMLDIGIIPRMWNELLTTYRDREKWDDDWGVQPTTTKSTHG